MYIAIAVVAVLIVLGLGFTGLNLLLSFMQTMGTH